MTIPGASPTIVDPQDYPDGVIRLRRRGESNDFLQIHVDGAIYSGNGTASPTQAAGATPTMIAKANGDDFAVANTTSSAGNSSVSCTASGAASASAAVTALSGSAQSEVVANAEVDGNANVTTSVNGQNMIVAAHDGVTPALGFFGAGATARPAVDLTVLADVAGALVSLGLIVSV